MASTDTENSRRISIDLPNKLIEKFDHLKKEWGLRRRGAVLERLLEIVLTDDSEEIKHEESIPELTITDNQFIANESQYNENTALVLIPKNKNELKVNKGIETFSTESKDNYNQRSNSRNSAIDLPGFVRKRSDSLRVSLGKKSQSIKYEDPFVSSIKFSEIENALQTARNHWFSLYGQAPKENVVEAAMTWLALDIWPQIEQTDEVPFTWTAANQLMKRYSSEWEIKSPNLQLIVVIAGVLEDPFGTSSLSQRMPSLIRRFVNKFKRSNKVTSFQTLESTMTVHGALKLLDLPTYAGASLTLIKIRDAYKEKALAFHPDAGGSTEAMRRLNESYQLLKELYREKSNRI